MLVVVLLGHIAATAVGLDGFSTEASCDLFDTGFYGVSVTSRNKGIFPSRILSQVPDHKISPWQVSQPNSSTVELVDHTYDSRRVVDGHM